MQTFYYLIHIQYLGFRFHGWQKQPNMKTVHFMIDKTVAFIFKHDRFKTLGCSRTDARVSANHSAFELFLEEVVDIEWLEKELNLNLPNDIRVLKIETVDQNFNIINTPKQKEYMYLFCFGEKPHPFAASMLTYFKGNLDVALMSEGAKLFEGEHNFIKYCTKPSPKTNFNRVIDRSFIEMNTTYKANFFPESSYILHLHSKGFMRYQARLIMGQLVRLGRHEIGLDAIRDSLMGLDKTPLDQIAPGSGLILNKITFDY